jgi:hypothetical protein
MSYKILKSFWELLTPSAIRTPLPEPFTKEYEEYREIVSTNEAGEEIILHLPKNYNLSHN